MVEIADINDRKSLRAWLEGQPKEVSVWIARRAAMRVWPIYWEKVVKASVEKKPELSVLPMMFSFLVTEVARKLPNVENLTAVNVADLADFNEATYAAHAAESALITDIEVSHAGYVGIAHSDEGLDAATGAVANATKAVAYGSAAFASHVMAMWDSTRMDCVSIVANADLDILPLWAGKENLVAKDWEQLKLELAVSSPSRSDQTARGAAEVDWSFWIKWYDDALAGTPPNWDMLERIALIVPDDWDKGAERVNNLIADIEKEFAIKATPYSEEIIYDGKYHTVPHSQLPTRSLQDVLERLGDVIRYIRVAPDGNQYGPLLTEANHLEDILERYPTRPIRIYEACEAVLAHIVLDVTNGSLPENDKLVGDVVRDVQNSSDSIYELDAEAAKAVDGWTKRRYGRLTDAQKEAIVNVAEAVAQNSDNELGLEMREDANAVLAETDPEGETKSKKYRLGSRLVRILVLGGAGIGATIETLGAVEPAVSGAQYLWQVIRPLVGF